VALLHKEDIKLELGIDDAENNDLIEAVATGVLGLLDELTGRTWEQTALTEYFSTYERTNQILLNSYPVATSPAVQMWDDPDWEWGSTTLIPAADYRVDYVNGIIYYNSFFHIGKQSVKVSYTAGYSSLPAGVKQILIRQGAHWFEQAKDAKWDKSSIAQPSGMGTTSYKNMMNNLLPDFAMLIERESR
jgi:hypothetical protein